MPTYTHKCTECEHYGELMYSLSEFDKNETMECPTCGKPTWVRGLFSAPGFQIVGFCYENSIHGKKGRWRQNTDLHQKVLDGKANPY